MSFDVICFDCDSTLSKIEGIDELGKRAGLGDALVKLTNSAMDGSVPLAAVYGQRLALIKPDRASIDWLAKRYIDEMVDGVATLFDALHTQGKQVHIISGGLKLAILPLAQQLGVAEQCVHAVDLYFNDDGSYADYQQDSPLARNGGKAEVCQQLNVPANQLMMVGDGKTDLEAKQAGAFFIGFGGVVDREVVRENADVFISGSSLLPILAYV